MKYFSTALTFFLATYFVSVQAQYFCGTDYYDSIEIAKDPSILERRLELEKFTKSYLAKGIKGDEKIIIPVVYHVLHQYGEERLTMQQIENGIIQINKDYSASNNELGGIVSAFKDIIGDANIEFRLAKKDPNGDCTTGVVYYDTDLTYKASNYLKTVIKNWDRTSYLNIWTVSSIESGAAAWSHYPDISSTYDGVVSIYKYATSGHTLGHEVGHYLNLPHPWGSTNEPGLDSNCNIDDGVDDTPLTIGADQHCNLNQVSCGSLDNIQNFMDYSTCDAMFTIGQTERMHAALNSTIGGRKYLWTEDNLIETGTNDGYEPELCAPVADFINKLPGVKPGGSLVFKDYSYGSEITEWNWVFEGGTPETSAEQNPEITYKTPGLYSVSLSVKNSVATDQLIRQNLIFVTDTLQGIVAPEIVDMEDESFPFYQENIFKAWSFEDKGSEHWSVFNNGNTSMRIKNYGNEEGTINSMITPNINLSNIENPEYLYFDYAYAQKNLASSDELKIYVSSDCGGQWIIKQLISGKSMVTSNNEFVDSDFVPNADEWKQAKIPISNFNTNNFLKVKFDIKSRGGNYLYIDNLVVGEPNAVKSNLYSDLNLKVYPNPTNSIINIKFEIQEAKEVNLFVCNILGEQIYNKTINAHAGLNHEVIFSANTKVPNGMYLLTLKANDFTLTKRVVIAD